MEKGRVVVYGHEQQDLRRRQNTEEPKVETATTLEDLQERYADLAGRITALPSSGRYRPTDLGNGRGMYLDRHVYAYIDTGDKKIPGLQLHLQTGHFLDEEGDYNPRESSYLIADWIAPGVQQRERLNSPAGAIEGAVNVTESARILGLLEESVIEAEKVLSPAVA